MSGQGPDPDADILPALRAGEEEAVRVLVQRHWEGLVQTAYAVVRQRQDAEDLAQEAPLRAVRGIQGFRGEAKLSTWLHQILLNGCRSWLRKRAVRRFILPAWGERAEGEPGPPDPADESPGARAEASAESADFNRRLERALAGLGPVRRMVLILRHQEGLDISEIAARLGCAEGTVKAHLSRGADGLKEAFRTWM